MKKLSLVIALALICLSFFSCENKSIISPLDKDFKITTFSPASGFVGSEVTLFGENLDKDSIVMVMFGDQTAEILTKTDSMLIVKVPDIAVGKYYISVNTKAKSYVYDTKYEVLIKTGITNFLPTSGYINTSVSLFGDNFDKDSVISVQFGNQNTEILSQSSDSIIVKVPNIQPGKYDILVKTKTNSYLYDAKFEVLAFDFSQFKSYQVKISGFNLKYNTHHILKDMGTYENDMTHITNSYSRTLVNTQPLEFSFLGNNSYKYSENLSKDGKTIKNSISFSFDDVNFEIKKISIAFFNSSSNSSTYRSSYSSSNLKFDIQKIGVNISNNGLVTTIKLNKQEVLQKMENFYSGWFSSSSEWQYHSIDQSDDTKLIEFLGVNDDAFIEIKFTK